MGLSPMSSCDGDFRSEKIVEKYIESIPNPDPSDFVIIRVLEIDTYLIVLLHYNGCTNFGGDKLLVYRGTCSSDFRNRFEVDPHFNKTDNLIARFIPTDEGWDMAILFVNAIIKKED